MRVVAGELRGRRLRAPGRSGEVRPTADRVREALFSVLGDVAGARVLDLYCGTGALAIEALSRGAATADLVERARAAVAAIRSNLERTGVVDRATVHATDVERFLERPGVGPWDLAVLDPPYEARAIVAPLAALAPRLAPGATVVVKHFWRTEVPERVDRLARRRQRRFGETMLTFFELEDA